MRYSLRAATEADYDFLYRLNEATMREYVIQAFGGWEDAFHAQLFRERFDPSKIRIVVVADRDIGMVETGATETEVVLANIRIAPEYQGRGLGTAIVTEILAEARQADRPVRLRVLKVNPARRLYERLGFSVVEETPTHYVMRALPSSSR
jgi:ribosomal protein S18 acetylase RimI-like enzyme